MRKLLAIVAGIALLAQASFGQSAVTQVSGWSVADGARDHALRNIVITDLPAVINSLNQVVTNGSVASATLTGIVNMPGVAVSVTQDQEIAVAQSIIYLSSTDAAQSTNALAAPATDGDQLVVINVGTAAVTIADSGTFEGSGDAVLGVLDTLSAHGVVTATVTQWVEKAQADN